MIRFLPLFFAAWLFADGHILLYHRVGEVKPSGVSMNVSVAKLRADMQYLKDNGYKVIALSELLSKVNAKEPIDDKIVVITVDDAYKSFYKNGVPILKEFGYPYTLLVYVEAVNSKWPDYMNWDDVNSVVKNGNEIGLHSYGHLNMTEVPIERVAQDTQKSLEIYKQKTSQTPKYYAYPFGSYNASVQQVIESIGVQGILTVDNGAVTDHTNPMALPRSALNSDSDLKSILKTKALNVKITQSKTANGMTQIKGELLDSNLTKLNVFIAKNNRKSIDVKDGKFEFDINKSTMNSKRKLIFYSGAKTATKTLPMN